VVGAANMEMILVGRELMTNIHPWKYALGAMEIILVT
jgi:hypothetical protein